MGGAEDGAGEAHAQVDAHATVAHDVSEVLLVGIEFKVGQEA